MNNRTLQYAGLPKHSLKVEYVSIHLLKTAAYNPRKWDDAAISQLTESIQTFGLVDPILVNSSPKRKFVVIGGHFRLKIAKDLGYTEVPVLFLNIPSIEKEKELNIRLNKNVGAWDVEKLRDFDTSFLADIGFSSTELEDLWDDALEIQDDSFDTEEELSKITKPKTKVGDRYQLGRHKLLCGSSLESEDVMKLLDGARASMVYCDPPYNINLSYDKGIGTRGKYGGKTNDSKSFADYQSFLRKTIENALLVARDDAHFFYWCDQNYVGMIQDLYRTLGIENRRTCLWIKNNQNVVPQVAFNKVYEPCVYGTRGTPYLSENHYDLTEVMNKEIGTGNALIEDILGLLDIWLIKRLPGQEYRHPTEKPPTLHQKALKRCTKVNDIVLDLFGGSGSTLIACEQLKRSAYLVEIEPVFCDLIINRFEALTGTKAIKL